MARPLRLEFENAVYHITARGNRKEKLFLCKRDNDIFIEKLNDTFEKYSFVCYAYSLMKNHYHLVIKTPYPNLSEGMHYLNASFANWFRVKHDRVGVIFQGRFKSILVDEERYALVVTSYVHVNATRAGLVKNIEDYEWSSYPDYIGIREPVVRRLDTSFVLEKFGANIAKARKEYRRYILEHSNMKNPLEDARNGIALGSEEFLEGIKSKIRLGGEKREIAASRIRDRLSAEKVIEIMGTVFQIERKEILRKRRGNSFRQLTLFLLKHYTDLTIREIGKIFGIDYTAVSMAVKRFEERLCKDPEIQAMQLKIIDALKQELCEM
jgi:putative transposase